ncbi:hypothetical protein NQ315_004081 [Exocentrus adspersus]|uniref:Uncharacterized protein n=1 Tax=Exocentrus adspersus TaxID=1586481 RepID=A0AAV8W7L0_9CUCU|nr:hypothetical protein NQ315_004081 [Exocentrus adspersus]
MYQRICASTRLLSFALKRSNLQILKANIYNKYNSKVEPLFRSPIRFSVPKRNFFQYFRRAKATPEELKIKDNVPDQYALIYRCKMERYLLYTQVVTVVCATVVSLCLIIRYDFSDIHYDYSDWKTPHRQVKNEYFVYLGSLITLVVFLQIVVSRLPVRIYNLAQQKKYILVFYGNLPFSTKRAICNVGDIVPLPEIEVLPWGQDRYMLKNKRNLIIFEQYFRKPADLYIMLGVQKDPDADEDNK